MVLAYFDAPYTTGYVESINRFLDDLQRDGRGYSFPVIRAKLLLAEKLDKKTFRPKKGAVVKHPDALYYGMPSHLEAVRWGVDLDYAITSLNWHHEAEKRGSAVAFEPLLSTLDADLDEAA